MRRKASVQRSERRQSEGRSSSSKEAAATRSAAQRRRERERQKGSTGRPPTSLTRSSYFDSSALNRPSGGGRVGGGVRGVCVRVGGCKGVCEGERALGGGWGNACSIHSLALVQACAPIASHSGSPPHLPHTAPPTRPPPHPCRRCRRPTAGEGGCCRQSCAPGRVGGWRDGWVGGRVGGRRRGHAPPCEQARMHTHARTPIGTQAPPPPTHPPPTHKP